MRLSKEQISNGVWILAIVLILFTPIGFHLRVMVGKLFATKADVVAVDEQKTLSDYQWRLVDMEGNVSNFESYEGKVVLVNFWATWCPPCIAELPSLAKLHQDFGNRVAFAFVANDEVDKVSQFLKKKGLRLPVYFETSGTPEVLVSKSIPATYILSKTGKVVVAEKGAVNWNSKATRNLLDQLLLE